MARPKNYCRGNEEAARIILADPERYAGLALKWARLWVERHGIPKKEPAAATQLKALRARPMQTVVDRPSTTVDHRRWGTALTR
jgi:hypothetical protein